MAVASLALVAACTGGGGDPVAAPRHGALAVVPVYFFDGRALSQEYRRLAGPDPLRALVEMVLEGPRSKRLRSAVPPATRLIDASEGAGGLIIELNEAFWRGTDASLRRRAAQLVYSVATLEEGNRVTLLRGLVPGRLPGTDQPVERSELEAYRPWLEVTQPVAGALLGRSVPIDVEPRTGYPIVVSFVAGDDVVASMRVTEPGPVDVPPEAAGPGTVVLRDAAGHRVAVPVRFSGR